MQPKSPGRLFPLFYSLLLIGLLLSCNLRRESIPEPTENPHLLQPGKFVPTWEMQVNTDTLPAPKVVPARGKYVRSGPMESKPLPSKYSEVTTTFIPVRGRKVNMDSFAQPTFVPATGKKVPARWPEWQPVEQIDRQFPFFYLDVEHGLIESNPSAFLEDQDRNIWIGTYNRGISIWDGKGFVSMTEDEGLSSNYVRSLLEDQEGNIWIGTAGGGLNVWDGTNFTQFGKEEGLTSDSISCLLQDREGKIWIGTNVGGVNVWDGTEFMHLTEENGLVNDTIQCLLKDGKGKIWIGTMGGLSVWDGSGFTQYTEEEGLPDNEVRDLLEDHMGNVWIGIYRQGISVWNADSHKDGFIHHRFNTHNNNISRLAKGQEGNIWIGTEGRGACVWDGAGFTIYSEEEGLSQRVVLALQEDHGGRIWIGTFLNGVSVWNNGGFSRYTMQDGLLGNTLIRLLEDHMGRIWIGQHGGGLNVLNGSELLTTTTRIGLIHNHIRALLKDSHEKVWIGTYNGLSVWDGAGFTNFTEKEGLSNNHIRSLLEDDKGRIWIGTNGGGINVWDPDNNSFTYLAEENGLSSNMIRCLLKDQKGRIWIGTLEGGVNVWHPPSDLDLGRGNSQEYQEKVTHFTKKNGLSGNDVYSILEDDKGKIWIGTDKGLNIWDGAGFTQYTEKDGLNSNIISKILQDHERNIWLATSRGLNRLIIGENKDSIRVESFLIPDGLSNLIVRDLLLDQQNQLWIATGKGLNRLDLNTFQSDTTRPTLAIRDLQPFYDFFDWREVQDSLREGKKLTTGEEKISLAEVRYDSIKPFTNLPINAEFPYNINQLTIRWSGIHHAVQHKLQYRYILEGKDRAWSPPVKENRITYHDLQPGRYTFKVRAVGGNGLWSETDSWSFRIRPPWWLSGVAKASYLLLGMTILYFLFRWRTRAQRQQIAQQEKDLARERQLTDRLQRVDQLKDQFLANTSHELRTPLQGIIGLSEALQDRSENPQDQEDLSMIISSGKRLNNLVNDILDFSKLKNFDIELQRKPVNLRVLTDIVLKNNAPLVKGKDLQLINDIPEDLPPANGDENRLQQVLYNLVGNAVKFTESGYVKVGAGISPAGGGPRGWKAPFTAEETEKILPPPPSKGGEDTAPNYVTIYVEDTGIGIPENKKDAIFQEFEQADGSISREFAGTGLGLSISRRLVELHGGEMWVESEVGMGSRFYFSLPMSTGKVVAANAAEPLSQVGAAFSPSGGGQGEEFHKASTNFPITASGEQNPLRPPASDTSPRRGQRPAPIHILVVDDEPINQQVLKNHLSGEHIQLTQAMNGEEAMRALASGRAFDLVLLDVMMPRMSGYEVCQQIRQKYLPSELPVIMVTAKNQVTDLVQGLSLGANDYLAKPFSKEEFLARVKTQLDLHRINSVTGKFVPNEFLRSLGRERITEVTLGDLTEKEVTVFFSDIRDYTTLAETMTPEQNFRFVNAYNGRMGPIIQQHNGFVNQYLGDAIMAIFPEEPADALNAAVDMQTALRKYNQERLASNRKPLRVGMGLHTGPLIMGIIGDQKRLDAATISDTVNTASRIESLTKYYGANILIGMAANTTPDHLSSSLHLRYLGLVQVKGKTEPVSIYECLDGDEPAIAAKKQETLSLFEAGLRHFLAREFPAASGAFDQILKVNPQDLPARHFLNRTARYMLEGVPDSWTGVELMDRK